MTTLPTGSSLHGHKVTRLITQKVVISPDRWLADRSQLLHAQLNHYWCYFLNTEHKHWIWAQNGVKAVFKRSWTLWQQFGSKLRDKHKCQTANIWMQGLIPQWSPPVRTTLSFSSRLVQNVGSTWEQSAPGSPVEETAWQGQFKTQRKCLSPKERLSLVICCC